MCEVAVTGNGWKLSVTVVPMLVRFVIRLDGLALSGLSMEVRDATEFERVFDILDEGES